MCPRFTRVVNTSAELDIHKADSLIADSDIRNEQIISDVEQAIAADRTPVILTSRSQTLFLTVKIMWRCSNET